MQTAEQQILERIKVSRGTSEPAPAEPTEVTEAVDVSEDTPIESESDEQPLSSEEPEQEVEESAHEESEQATYQDEEEDLYVEYKGREINLKDVDEWERGHLRQADYTRKTQELADSRKDFEAKEQALSAKETKLNEQLSTLEAIIAEDSKTAEELSEMREYEPDEYIKYVEKQDKRKKLLSNKTNTPSFNVEEEKQKLWNNNPSWLNDGKQTEAFTKDMDMLTKYADSNGYTNEDLAGFSAKNFQTLIDAAKYKALNTKNAAIEKKVRRAPVTTRPKASAKGLDTEYNKAVKAFKANPSDKNAVALRKLKRQLNK